jgi:formamidopyrimidine-DNA glycosylase
VPEGDTIYKLARRLDAALAGRVLARGRLNVPAHATADLAGYAVEGTTTHGKHLLTRLRGQAAQGGAEEALTLHTHLRMDGDWALLHPGKVLPRRVEPDVRALLVTDTGRTAAALRMPVVELLRTAEEHTVVGHLGPDLLHPGFDAAEAVRRLRADPDRPLVAALLDQRVVAGLGNLWANEMCYLLGRSPWTPVGEVDAARVVARAARALRFSATSPTGYQVTTGDTRPGRDHWVTGRAGKPCLRCATSVQVVQEVPGDPGRRRTWWCPHCQPGPPPDR